MYGANESLSRHWRWKSGGGSRGVIRGEEEDKRLRLTFPAAKMGASGHRFATVQSRFQRQPFIISARIAQWPSLSSLFLISGIPGFYMQLLDPFPDFHWPSLEPNSLPAAPLVHHLGSTSCADSHIFNPFSSQLHGIKKKTAEYLSLGAPFDNLKIFVLLNYMVDEF